MSKRNYTRREFVKKNSMAGIGAAVALSAAPALLANCAADTGVPAILGGQKIRTKEWPVWPQWKPEVYEEQVLKVLRSGVWSRAKVVTEFENKWAETIGTKYAIAVNSGTSALITGLYSLKYLANDEKRKKIITTPLTFIATSSAIKISGLEPAYADVDKKRFSIKPSQIQKLLDENDPSEFLAILPVHLMGYACDMDKINEIAKKYNLFVFEDAAQAHGSKYNGKNVGSFGDLADFSFYIAHNIQAGELGVLNTNNNEIKKLAKKIKAHGRICVCDICRRMEGKCPEIISYKGKDDFDPRFTHDLVGFNFKANEFSTALATLKINDMAEINKKRRENVAYLNEGLKKHSNTLQLPEYSEDVSYLGYPLVTNYGNRKEIRSELEKRGIETRVLFGCIPTQQPAFKEYKEQYAGKLPNAEFLGKNGFYIGCHQFLTQQDLDYIIKSFDEILK